MLGRCGRLGTQVSENVKKPNGANPRSDALKELFVRVDTDDD